MLDRPGFVVPAGVFFSAALWAVLFGFIKAAMVLACGLFLCLLFAV